MPMSTTQTWGEKFAAMTAEARLLMTILLFFGRTCGAACRPRRLRALPVVGGAHAGVCDPADARR